MNSKSDKKVAILVANGFEQVEMVKPKEALEQAGVQTFIVSPEDGQVQGSHHADKGDTFPVDKALAEADASDYDALVLPGGVFNPDALRVNDKALDFVRAFFKSNKLVACICHGGWTLINAGVVKGRRMTSYQTISTDLKNAGADWVDEEVVKDGKLITSRNPDDLPAFCKSLVGAL